MDIRKLLERDHRDVESNFQALERAGFADDDLVEELLLLLETHTELEEQVFYPALEDDAPEMVDDARHAHEQAKDLMAEVRATNAGPRRDLIEQLRDVMTEHINEEEADLFPRAGEVIGRTRLARLGEEAAELRDELLNPASVEEKPAAGEEEEVEVTGADFREAAREIEHDRHPDEEPAPGP